MSRWKLLSWSFDVWLLNLDLFAACEPLSMDLLFFFNEDWEIPNLWNASKNRKSVICDWDSKNEIKTLNNMFRKRCEKKKMSNGRAFARHWWCYDIQKTSSHSWLLGWHATQPILLWSQKRYFHKRSQIPDAIAAERSAVLCLHIKYVYTSQWSKHALGLDWAGLGRAGLGRAGWRMNPRDRGDGREVKELEEIDLFPSHPSYK